MKNIFKILISTAVFIILASYLDINQAKAILLQASPLFLFFVLLVFLVDRFFMSWKWTILLKAMQEPINQFFAFKVYYISSFLGMFIPFGVGPDVIRFIKVKKAGARSDTIMTSIIMERVLGLISTLCIVVMGLLIFFAIIKIQKQKNEIVILAILFFLAIVLGLGILFNDRVWHHTVGSAFIETLFNKLGGSQYYDNFMRFQEKKNVMLLFTILSFFEQFFAIFAVYLGAKALSIPINFIGCLAFVPLTIMAERLPLSFMGIGLREGTYILLLGRLNIDYTSAMLFSLLIFVLEIIFLLPAGIWSLFEEKISFAQVS